MVLHELEAGLRHHSLIASQEQLQHFRELLAVVKEEYEDLVKNEVQRTITADAPITSTTSRLTCSARRFGTATRATTKSPMNGCCDRSKSRSLIPDGRKDDFRREIMNYIVL
jgi:serine protein kinase